MDRILSVYFHLQLVCLTFVLVPVNSIYNCIFFLFSIMFISNLLLLLACVIPLVSTLPHPISSNIAVYSSVSVTCGQFPCDYPQEESALINDNNNDTVWDSIGTVGSEYHITLTFIQVSICNTDTDCAAFYL